jgi:hypothetical protein
MQRAALIRHCSGLLGKEASYAIQTADHTTVWHGALFELCTLSDTQSQHGAFCDAHLLS